MSYELHNEHETVVATAARLVLDRCAARNRLSRSSAKQKACWARGQMHPPKEVCTASGTPATVNELSNFDDVVKHGFSGRGGSAKRRPRRLGRCVAGLLGQGVLIAEMEEYSRIQMKSNRLHCDALFIYLIMLGWGMGLCKLGADIYCCLYSSALRLCVRHQAVTHYCWCGLPPSGVPP